MINAEVLERNIRVVAEALSRFLFDLAPSQPLAPESFTVNPRFIGAWLTTVATYPRVPGHSPANFTLSLAQVFEEYSGKATVQSFAADDTYQFYSTAQVTMHAYRVKSMLFDLVLALAIGALLYAVNLNLQKDIDLSPLAKFGAATPSAKRS